MLQTYVMNGKEFQTITIPKGTLLFRGLTTNKDNPDEIFNDLIGMRASYGHCIAPTRNVFFYPAPYASHVVDDYTMYSLYLTQYDIELLLLINPSELTRDIQYKYDKDDVITSCATLTEYDKCGKIMDTDPCITEEAIKQFPNIAGYIAIAETDKNKLQLQIESLFMNDMRTQILQMLPAIASNSRGFIGMPEIVIHPLHLRQVDVFKIRGSLLTPYDCVKYALRKRAQYNYFPLLYITRDNVFSFNELQYKSVIDQLAKKEPDGEIIPIKLFRTVKRIMNRLLSNYGYKINGVPYYVTIDTRTGFYRIICEDESCSSIGHGKLRLADYEHDKGFINKYIIPFTYPIKDKQKILKLIVSDKHTDKSLIESRLTPHEMSLTHQYIFDKGSNNYRRKFHVDNVLERRDLKEYKNRILRNITRKMKAMNNIYYDAPT